MGRGPKPKQPPSCASSEAWERYYARLEAWNQGGNSTGREARQGQSSYSRGSRSGGYGRSAYSYRSGTFDGLPSLSRKRDDGATEIFYQAGTVDMDDPNHGHAVIKDGKLVYKREPGASTPVINND